MVLIVKFVQDQDNDIARIKNISTASKEQAQASLIVKRLQGKGKKIKTPDKVLWVDLARLTSPKHPTAIPEKTPSASAQQKSTAVPETTAGTFEQLFTPCHYFIGCRNDIINNDDKLNEVFNRA